MQVLTILPIIPYTQSLAMESVRDFFILFKTSSSFAINYISSVFLNKVN